MLPQDMRSEPANYMLLVDNMKDLWGYFNQRILVETSRKCGLNDPDGERLLQSNLDGRRTAASVRYMRVGATPEQAAQQNSVLRLYDFFGMQALNDYAKVGCNPQNVAAARQVIAELRNPSRPAAR